MSRSRAAVRDGVLTYRDGELDQALAVGSPTWQRWLQEPGVSSFRVEAGAATYTARRQAQRGRWYWYAYRRRAGRLRKRYLGRPGDLTSERLEAVATHFAASDPTPAQDLIAPEPRPASSVRHNLPRQLTSFLGRESEREELRRILTSDRLVTLTGAGGMGKTRLALDVAATILQETTAAVWLVELAPLTDPALVSHAIAQAAGIREEQGQPLLTTLAAGLGAGPVLLLLDNCEHLIETCAPLADHLLRVCPELRLLATSREPLGVPGEVAWRVPSLNLPDPASRQPPSSEASAAAVRLFVERAGAVRPGFALTPDNAGAVADICHRLDGIPLAIELAATQVRVLDPRELAARLDDRFLLLAGGSRTAVPRHRTLQATLDWSYDLLTETERRCFDWLSVFAGGFTLAAAESVCGEELAAAAGILDLVSRLVDRSLVQVEPDAAGGETRYRLLEILRAYGATHLEQRLEADRARARHASWLMDRAEQAARAFRGPEQGYWLRWAEREHDNVRAALTWALERNQAALAIRLAVALSWSWLVHQRWSEGLDWVRRALALPAASPTRERGQLLCRAIELSLFRGDLTSNRPTGDLTAVGHWVEECLSIGETLADLEIMHAAYGLQQLVREFGVPVDTAPAQDPEAELTALRHGGDTWGERRALESLARDALRRGELDIAGDRLREAIALARTDGDGWSLAMGLNELGDVERARGRHHRAKPLYEESAELFAALGLGDQPNLLHNLGYVALSAGDRASATTSFMEALRQFRRLGERRGAAECLLESV